MQISKINPNRDTEEVNEIIKIYQEAFGSTPWNEGWKCSQCGNVLPLYPIPTCCQKCRAESMVQYWPYEQVLADFKEEMGMPRSLCLVATEQKQIIAFAWGYEISGHDPSTSKHLDAPNLHNLLNGDFFYLDDIAVRPDRQQDGIGKKLVKEIFEKQDNKRMLLRTLRDSQMSQLILRLGGQSILPISRERVIMTLARD
jgi:GNAT superfamily N-acetyltransferase